jgi:hypothetical protein
VKLATNAVLDVTNVPTYSNGASGVGATLTEATTTTGTLTVDGVALLAADATNGTRILVKNQASALTNGYYRVTTMGGGVAWVLTRTTDADTPTEFHPGAFSFVEAGTVNSGRGYTALGPATGTLGGFAIGTDAILFTQFSATGANTFTLPLLDTSGTISLNRAAPLGLDGSNNLTVVGLAAAAAEGRMLVGSANATTASTYSDTFGTATANLSLKVTAPTALPTTFTDNGVSQGAVNLAHGKTLATTELTPGVLFGALAKNSTALVASQNGGALSQFYVMSRNTAADSWNTVAVFTHDTT